MSLTVGGGCAAVIVFAAPLPLVYVWVTLHGNKHSGNMVAVIFKHVLASFLATSSTHCNKITSLTCYLMNNRVEYLPSLTALSGSLNGMCAGQSDGFSPQSLTAPNTLRVSLNGFDSRASATWSNCIRSGPNALNSVYHTAVVLCTHLLIRKTILLIYFFT